MEKINNVVITGPREVTINDKPIPIKVVNPSLTEDQIHKALNSRKFLGWAENLNLKGHRLEWIEIRDIFMFGSIVGFICVSCRVLPNQGADGIPAVPIPGYVFLRGDAVVILAIIVEKETGKKYMVLTDQYRLPLGDAMIEFPAGMMDEQRNFKGQAATELKQEAGIEMKPEDLKELLTFGPSLGGCDEKITVFYCELMKTKDEIKEIESRIYGELHEGEIIKVRIVEFDVAKLLSLNKVHASATLCAMFAYQNLVEKKFN